MVSRADPASARAFLAANGPGATSRRSGEGEAVGPLSKFISTFVEISLLSGEPPSSV